MLEPRCEEAIVFLTGLCASVTSCDSTVFTPEIRSMHTAVCELVVQWEHRVSYVMNDQKAGKAREDNGSISNRRWLAGSTGTSDSSEGSSDTVVNLTVLVRRLYERERERRTLISAASTRAFSKFSSYEFSESLWIRQQNKGGISHDAYVSDGFIFLNQQTKNPLGNRCPHVIAPWMQHSISFRIRTF